MAKTVKTTCRGVRRATSQLLMGLFFWSLSGCDTLSFLALSASPGAEAGVSNTIIEGDVTSSAETGLPQTLSGTITEEMEGAYSENILEVYFDENGAPIAALSHSYFTIDAPEPGTLTSVNLIVVVETMLSTDEAGDFLLDEMGLPIPLGLITAATGEVIHGTGAFEGVSGDLSADSTLIFGGGEFGLGTLDSNITLFLTP